MSSWFQLRLRLPYRPSVQRTDDDAFPEDLTGHFWTESERLDEVNRWRFTIWDY